MKERASTLEELVAEFARCSDEGVVMECGADTLRRRLDLLERMSLAIAQANQALDDLPQHLG